MYLRQSLESVGNLIFVKNVGIPIWALWPVSYETNANSTFPFWYSIILDRLLIKTCHYLDKMSRSEIAVHNKQSLWSDIDMIIGQSAISNVYHNHYHFHSQNSAAGCRKISQRPTWVAWMSMRMAWGHLRLNYCDNIGWSLLVWLISYAGNPYC